MKGFSLIELLLALLTTLTLGMLLFHSFHHNERVIRDETLIMEMQQTARVVASQIADEIRMAGQEVPVYSSNTDPSVAEAVAAILGTSTNSRIDFRGGLSNAETGVTGTVPIDLSLGVTRTLTVADGTAFSTALSTTTPSGKFVYVWGPTSNSTWAWVRAQLLWISSTMLMVTPSQNSNMASTIHFTHLPTVALEEAVSIYLSSGLVRRSTATDLTNPANPVWSASNDIGRNVTALNFTYYDKSGNVVSPTTLTNRNSITRVDIQLTVQAQSPLSNGTLPTHSLSLRTIARNLTLRSMN
jgi:Tfp pilus assembly protein PilW